MEPEMADIGPLWYEKDQFNHTKIIFYTAFIKMEPGTKQPADALERGKGSLQDLAQRDHPSADQGGAGAG